MKITIKGWTDGSGIKLREYIKSIEQLPIFGLLYTNVSKEGKLQGIDLEPIRDIVGSTKKKLFVAGGVSSIEDIEALSSSGAYGAILGMAIYKGKINLKDALERFG